MLQLTPVNDGLGDYYSTVELNCSLRNIDGYTRVREYDYAPTHLKFDDLDLDLSKGFGFEAEHTWHNWRINLSGEYFEITGDGYLPFDVIYDEGLFIADTPFKLINGRWWHFMGLIEWIPEFLMNSRQRIGLIFGGRFDHIDLGLDNGLDRSTENYSQFLPYPIAGFEYERVLLQGITLDLKATGGFLPRSPTFQFEGGMLHMRVRDVEIDAKVFYRLSNNIDLLAGVEYLDWAGRLESTEDGNKLAIRSSSVMLGVRFRF